MYYLFNKLFNFEVEGIIGFFKKQKNELVGIIIIIYYYRFYICDRIYNGFGGYSINYNQKKEKETGYIRV